MAQIDSLLLEVLEKRGSDLHFIAGDPPRIRLFGDLAALRPDKLAPEFVKQALYEILPKAALERFEAKDGADFAYALPDRGRFRVNVMRHLNGMGAVFRAIPSKALTLEELKMPDAVRQMCRANNGLILVTGKTGSGKSTTLAAMVDDINRRVKGHILTVEDPIEFVHERKGCLISQREIGVHSPSFAAALHSALREDPDVILIGELRDLETMSIAVTAAEMGILVMGTLHTNGAAPTVDRMVNAFPSDKQSHVRTMLSTSLRGVISQQLLQRADSQGRVAALEILVNTPAASNLIRQGKLDQLGHTMEYIQADIWVRFQRMQGNQVHFMCADDAHGAPIMLKAQSEGVTPQQLIARLFAGRPKYLQGFHLSFDHWYTTDSPENTQLSQDIYARLKAAGLVYQKPVEQFYDPVKGMFLADRYIKGECPNCHSKDQYGDACEVCSTVYAPTDLINPYSALTGAPPVLKASEHFFFRLSDPRCVAFLKEWLDAAGRLQPQVANKAREWLAGSGELRLSGR